MKRQLTRTEAKIIELGFQAIADDCADKMVKHGIALNELRDSRYWTPEAEEPTLRIIKSINSEVAGYERLSKAKWIITGLFEESSINSLGYTLSIHQAVKRWYYQGALSLKNKYHFQK